MQKDFIKQKDKYAYTQNRELSWLRFNKRVLEEADDSYVPAFERLKFISIFSSNLDEFFMVRVGSLFDIAQISPKEIDNKTGMTAKEQLRQIYNTIPGLIKQKEQTYKSVMKTLYESGIEDISFENLKEDELKQVNNYFKTDMLPILSPIIIGPHHPIPHLVSKQLYVTTLLENKKSHKFIGIVPVPETLHPFLKLSDSGRFIRIENILSHFVDVLFSNYKTKETCVICVTRNADFSFDDEKFEDNEQDFRGHMSKLLKKRDNLCVIRLELSKKISNEFYNKISSLVNVESQEIYVDTCPLNMKYVFSLISSFPSELTKKLLYSPYSPRWPEDIKQDSNIIFQIQKQDKLLFYPFDSVEPFLKLLNEAAENPDVLSIKITIYRLASSSKIARILSRAAENGKEVLVLMELRARFDEANNLAWSKVLEESGCQVIYGMEGFKCHSKICLITMRSHGKVNYITQIGTGNYNEKTNAMYTDLSFMTASEKIGQDATAFFRNMLVNNLDGKYDELCVSPNGIKNMICQEIDKEIEKGSKGYICIKANSVTEREVMNKLSVASKAGVEIQLIIRGICCILPGISGYTDNIHITSVVGRYLEHARIYLFGRNSDERLYISSADLMTRNLNRRVEIACPIQNLEIKEYLKWILSCQLQDTKKASFMLSDGVYCRKQNSMDFDCQKYFMECSPHKKATEAIINKGFLNKAFELLKKIIHI